MTKSVINSMGRRMCAFSAAVLASLILSHQAEAQALDSFGGYTIVVTITNATAPFATSGEYRFLPSGADNSYAVVRISGDTEGGVGTYTYSKQSATTATLSFVDSGIGAGADNQLVFSSPRQGIFSLSLPSVPGAIQQGYFVARRGISPANIAGTIVTTTITEGTGQFANSGSTRFQPRADNTYTNEALFGNVVSSSGTSTYTKNSDSGAEFSMNDSETGPSTAFKLFFDSAVSGSFLIFSTTNASEAQTGTFTFEYPQLHAGDPGSQVLEPTFIKSGAGGPLVDVTKGNGVYVAVGGGGTVLRSLDGVTWQRQFSGEGHFHAVVYAQNMFVAVGVSSTASGSVGFVTTSRNGIHWDRRYALPGDFINDIAFGHGQFVAAGTGGLFGEATVYTSPNGVEWTRQSLGGMGAVVNSIATGPNGFVAVGQDGSSSAWVSADGSAWTQQSITAPGLLLGLVYAHGQFVAVGGDFFSSGAIVTSPDGQTWTQRSTTAGHLNAVAGGPNGFLAVGSGGSVITSADGASWTSHVKPFTDPLYGVAHIGGSFVVVGESHSSGSGVPSIYTTANGSFWNVVMDGMNLPVFDVAEGNGALVAVGEAGLVMRQTSGSGWQRVLPGVFASWIEVVYGAGLFVAVGTDYSVSTNVTRIMTSTDGLNWVQRQVFSNDRGYSIVHANGRFVVVGEGAEGGGPFSATSTDGINWTRNQINSNAGEGANAVAFGNGQFVAVGSTFQPAAGFIYTSTDGQSWQRNALANTPPLFGITHGNGTFAAVGGDFFSSGAIVTSPDGQTWTQRVSQTGAVLFRVAYGNNRFVTVGQGGTVWSSANGSTWTQSTSPVPDDLWHVRWLAGRNDFVVVGGGAQGFPNGAQGAATSVILSTTTAADWQVLKGSCVRPIYDVALGSGIYVAVGEDGVLTSGDRVNWTRRVAGNGDPLYEVEYANGQFVAVGTGPAGGQILTSGNGVNWQIRYMSTNKVVNGIAYGNGRFVVPGWTLDTGNGASLVSTDGVTWTEHATPEDPPVQMNSVTFGNGVFAATAQETFIGQPGSSRDAYVMTSTDGQTWTPNLTPSPDPIWGIDYSNGRFVAVGGSAFNDRGHGSSARGVILTSSDGSNWTLRLASTNAVELTQVTGGAGIFVATDIAGGVYRSGDGDSWEFLGLATGGSSLWRVRYLNTRFLAVGAGGTILEGVPATLRPAPPLLKITREGGNVVIRWDGAATGFNLDGRGQFDAAAWNSEAVTFQAEGNQLKAIISPTGNRRFFRLRLP
jgi:hypothetical protein